MKKFKLIAGISTAVTAAALSFTVLSASAAEPIYGDANCDGEVSVADATLILQYLGNKDKYKLSAEGAENADVYLRGDGLSAMDALAIQKYDANAIASLPESWLETSGTTTASQGGPQSTTTTTTVPDTAITYIHLNGSSADIDGSNAEAKGGIITISHSGTFYIDGTLSDGQINVNIADEAADPETVKIFLNGVNITGKSAPAILVTNAENTSINLVDGTENFISDGDTAYSGDYLGDAVIEAKDDITIKGGEMGTGILNLTANTQDGIVCNNDIKVTGGVINVTTLNETDKTNGINGKKSLTVKGGTLNVDAEGDGIKSSKGNVSVTGGYSYIKAGNDAVQSETTIDVSGSGVLVAGGNRGLTGGTGVNITGGTVIATATDNQTDSALMGGTTQGTMLLNCVASGETDGCWKKANALTAGDIKAYKWQKKYAYVLLSDASIKADGTYKLKNSSTNANAIHDYSVDFKMSGTVTVFDNVNPSGDGFIVTPEATLGYTVTLNGTSVESNAPSDVATVENGVLTIKKEGSYSVSGKASEVQIVVDVDKTAYPDSVVELNLENADISNSTTAPIYVANIGDEVQIIAKAGTVNTISDGTSHTQTYTDSDGNTNTVEGAIFARDDIKFKGSGSLTINGNTDDAVVCRNDIKIYNGNITVNAVDDGIRGKDSVTIGNDTATDYANLKLTVKTQQGDGIKSTATDTDTTKQYGIVTINGGTVDINSYTDGIQAEQDFVMNGGELTVYTYEGSGFTGTAGGSTGSTNPWGGGFGGGMGGMQDGNSNKTDISAKGIKAVGLYDTAGTTWQSGGNITINGGNITIDSSDDSLHCGGQMNINGGTFKIASADDAFHSDHDLILGTKGGSNSDFNVYVSKCYEGVEGENIYQYSGTVAVKADDDGYNAAGGADSSGSGNNMGWGQGGFGGMGGGNNVLEISGGIAIVQSASGDHDAFDSNGNISVTGGIVIANGNEPLDCDGTKNTSGGTVATVSQGGSTVSAGTQFTIADESGNVIVSFTTMQAMGSPSLSNTSLKCYTGGTISGGTDLVTSDDSMKIYADGTISGGTAVTAGSSSGGNNTRPW